MAKKGIRFRITKRVVFRRILPIAMVLVIGGGGIYYGSQNASAGGSQQLIVYNWGEYMDSDVIDIFEEETGIHVVYEEYETNEIMYPKIKSGAISYDLVCPSDYMIQKMIQNDLLRRSTLTIFRTLPTLEICTTRLPSSSTRAISTRSRTAGEQLVFCTTKKW